MFYFALGVVAYFCVGLIFAVLVVLLAYNVKYNQYRDVVWLFTPVVVLFWPLALTGLVYQLLGNKL